MMKTVVRNTFVALSLALALVSCGRKAKIIPRKDMSKICADMIMADAWLESQSPELKSAADSSSFYEPIFNKYGYSIDDYLHSVDHYLNDPLRFSKIVLKAKNIIIDRKEEYEQRMNEVQGVPVQDSLELFQREQSGTPATRIMSTRRKSE